jgi:hypothetical protein
MAMRSRTVEQCRALFPRGQWHATYVVEAHMPLGNEGSFIGAVATESGRASFRSVLMTQEGFVLFDARYRAGQVEVLRILPPLDPERFGRSMTGDIRLTSFEPGGTLVGVGRSEDGRATCRWQDGKTTVDVELLGPGRAKLRRYDDGDLGREAELDDIDAHGFAKRATLRTTGMVGYSLSLSLIEAESLPSR